MSYKCRICRKILFTEKDVIPHEPAVKGTKCSSIFIEKPEWLEDFSSEENHLYCPKCKKKIGYYRWSGEQCNCGRWITPSFQITRNKVDEPTQIDYRTVIPVDFQKNDLKDKPKDEGKNESTISFNSEDVSSATPGPTES